MSMQKSTVEINPAVFRWAVTGSGWEEEELSEKTNIKLEVIQECGKSSTSIRISDLKKISKAINRPVSILLLPEPPDEMEPMDYRRMGGSDTVAKLSKKTLKFIWRARYVQASAAELLEMRSESAQPRIHPRTIRDDPETVAKTESQILDYPQNRHHGENIDKFVQNTYESLREKIESLGIFVMQMPIDIAEARGFVLSDKYPNVIVVSSKDNPRPRLFTLLHEYAHLLLKTGRIHTVNPFYADIQSKRQPMSVERWCNGFAGAVIMPREAVLEELEGIKERVPDSVVTLISRRFCTSKAAAAVRILNLLGGDPLWKDYYEYHKSLQTISIGTIGGGGGRDMAQECITHNGMRYVRLVSDSRKRDLITTHDMVMYLDLKTKHFENLEGMI